jgi:type I restriction-modification system DNA methylase subunit
MGFKGLRADGSGKSCNILEPSAGSGIFFNHMPQIIAKNANIDAIELDNSSCKLFSKLHGNINIINTGFENFCCNDNRYDLIIGNPPYGRSSVNDIFNPDLSHLIIHHWFVAKSAKMLRDKGIIAMILPQFFLDNVKDHARDIINKSGVNLIFAYRLPDNLFADAKITVDLVFLQKADKTHEWQATKRKTIGEHSKPINEYFFNNPHHVLGELEIVPMYDRMGITCKSSGDLRTQLAGVYSKIKKIL